MAYTKTNWQDLPSTNTPITANKLNNIEDEIEILDQRTDLGFAEMQTNTEIQIISSETVIAWWDSEVINFGDLLAQPNSSRIKITNTELLEIGGTISGINNVLASFSLIDSENNVINILGNESNLYSFNTYFTSPLKTLHVELDKNKIYYLSLKVNKYGENSFELNHGFGASGTTLYAKKIK